MRSLTWSAVLARRLARHHLLTPAPRAGLADVVSAICGVHAQVMPSAVVSLGLRVRDLDEVGLSEALWERRVLVKTFGLRGTVHLVPAREYGWWLAALRAARGTDPADDARRLARLGISARQLRDAADAIADALVGRRLTRAELGAAVARRAGRWAVERTVSAFGGQWPVWQAAIGEAALSGALCFGPPVGTRVTFVRPRDWLGHAPARGEPEAALRELFLRYLRAYGPAAERDFAQWSLAAPDRARRARELCGEAVERVEVEGQTLWQVAHDRVPRSSRASTLLLPRFDAYTVGAYPRDVIAPPAAVDRASATGLLPRRDGPGRAFLVGPMPVLLVDGVVAGIWESRRSARGIAIRVQPFFTLPRARRAALADAAERVGATVRLEPTLELGVVATRPHL